jgi:glycerophosphoryl diester phosphodiesterase
MKIPPMRPHTFSLIAALTVLPALGGLVAAAVAPQPPRTAPAKPWVVAHRGASAYAPENTVPAFQLAADQRATFIEFDLQLTKDRQLVCLHDNSLERTTDVEDVFPDRFRTRPGAAPGARTWMLEDFTLAEIKRLDAGAWFDAKFRRTRIPTFGETIDAAKGRLGLFIEVKSPERYEGIERQIIAELKGRGLDQPGADPRTPVLIQSFGADSLKIFAHTLGTRLPIHFLFGAKDAARWVTPEGLAQIKAFATGISPEKTIVTDHRPAMESARKMGLLITPYTFRASAVTGYPDVSAEMRHYLETLGVDGVITDNPDLMPKGR